MPAPRPKANHPGLQKAFDAYSDYMDLVLTPRTITAGRNMRHYEDRDSIHFESDAPAQSDGVAGPATLPFHIFCAKHLIDGIWDNSYDITLYPGAMNQQIASNMFAVVNQGVAATYYIILTATSDGYGITTYAWSVVSSQPTPAEATADTPPATFYVIVGVLFYDSVNAIVKIYQIVQSDLDATPAEWTRVSRSGASGFELAYQIYYYWDIQEAG